MDRRTDPQRILSLIARHDEAGTLAEFLEVGSSRGAVGRLSVALRLAAADLMANADTCGVIRSCPNVTPNKRSTRAPSRSLTSMSMPSRAERAAVTRES